MASSDRRTNETITYITGGCMLLGMAIGWYFSAFLIGMFGGLGLGLLIAAVVRARSAR